MCNRHKLIHKTIVLIIFLGFVGGLGLGDALFAEGITGSEGTLSVPVGTLKLTPPESVEAKRTPVEFPHSRHFTYACNRCHHQWDGGAELMNCTASDCHAEITSPKNPLVDGAYTSEAILYYKYAYHDLCVGCHKDIKTQNAAVPTGCVECHSK